MNAQSEDGALGDNPRRVAILFAGGPAPAANAVISTAAVSFLRNGIEVVGILNGYSHLVEYGPGPPAARRAAITCTITHKMLRRTRNSRGIMIGTARTNPGKDVDHPDDLDDPREDRARCGPSTRPSRRSASTRWSRSAATTRSRPPTSSSSFQEHLPDGQPPDRRRPRPQDDRQRLPRHRLHLRLLHGRRDPRRRDPQPPGRRRGEPAAITSSRRWAACAGWLAYGAAIAGEASLVMSVEDIVGEYPCDEEYQRSRDRASSRPAP